MSNVRDNFIGPFEDINLPAHILKFDKNVSVEEAMTKAMARSECGAIVFTDDNKVYYKTISHDEAIEKLKEAHTIPGHTLYIKKKN
tara:strand:+ start:222 stop:479 length:258 start_codon:yes stop_codon:yes gene_type:complete